MDFKNISENIKHYRYSSNLTQEELAKHSGLSLATIKKIETNESVIREKTLEAIANALNVSIDNLNSPAKKLSSIRFRPSRNVRSKESIISEIIEKLEMYSKLEELSVRVSEKIYKTAIIKSTPEENAAEMRRISGLDDESPINDISLILQLLGIRLFSINVDTTKLYSLSVGEKDGGPAVIINNNGRITYEQMLFSAAHELGHIIMHIKRVPELNNKVICNEEDEADRFASYFLMPEKGFEKYWNAGKGLSWTDRVIKVKQIFGLNYKRVLQRFGDYERLNKIFLRDYKDGGLKDDKDPEPLNRRFFAEEYMFSLAVEAINNKTVTIADCASLLKISKETMRKLVQTS